MKENQLVSTRLDYMRLQFLNRGRELAKLKRAFSSPEPVFIVIYGRRRCGKSTLLQQAAGKEDIYYLADQQEAPLQRQSIAREIGRFISGFGEVHYPSWEVLFTAAANQIPPGSVLILDEFPYLVQNSPELPSIIQKLLDIRQHKFHLVLCGSSQRMMQGLVLDSSAPLYGRAREVIRVRPLDPGWLPEALAVSPADAVEAYSVWGGVPRYLELAKDFPSLETACKHLILERDGVLHEEPMRLLLDDMRGAGQPHSLLALIGSGVNRLSEIAGRLGKPATNMTRPLANLVQLGYIKRELPFGDTPRASKRTLYSLEDPFLKFWYRLVLPNQSMLEQDLINEVWSVTEQQRVALVAEAWEELARKSVAKMEICGLRWKPASRWWGKGTGGKNMEIDVVAESVDGKSLLLGEAKWEKVTKLQKVLNSLHEKAGNFPEKSDKKIVLAVWSKQAVVESGEYGLVSPENVLTALR
jgi:hypothetical protein